MKKSILILCMALVSVMVSAQNDKKTVTTSTKAECCQKADCKKDCKNCKNLECKKNGCKTADCKKNCSQANCKDKQACCKNASGCKNALDSKKNK